ncbi:helix-turn-helix domain-containing protein [Dactylosporangium siamense]|uniref:helix-turn-helix domain-containing protein n=1 Tax=Dactylosporangium siamense TaxID=685454 RepID=UPI002FEDA279
MPLKVMNVVEQRLRIVAEVEAGRLTVRDTAVVFGASRTRLHEWLTRYRVDGAAGLVPRPLCRQPTDDFNHGEFAQPEGSPGL